jgi:hypothetical protein
LKLTHDMNEGKKKQRGEKEAESAKQKEACG